MFPKENGTECNQHINQTTYDSVTGRVRPYFGLFLPQRNLSFGKTRAYVIDIFLNIPESFSKRHAVMMAFDPGKKNQQVLYYVCFVNDDK